MLDIKKLNSLKLTKLDTRELREIKGGNADPGVWDDPNDPDNDGCIPNPFEKIIN